MRSQDFHDTHHLYWPKRSYSVGTEARFRNLPCHQVRLHRTAHNEIHATQPPPIKPPKAVMEAAIEAHTERRCPCGT